MYLTIVTMQVNSSQLPQDSELHSMVYLVQYASS
jgi:hypothetical protein